MSKLKEIEQSEKVSKTSEKANKTIENLKVVEGIKIDQKNEDSQN